MQVRGHTTGHLLSGLALTYASTGDPRAKAAGEYLVGQLAQLQAIAPLAGYAPGYLSAFPESFFDRLEAGQRVWSPYYMIHKYLAGMIDQYQLAGVGQALDVAVRLADWVDARTARLSYAHMQQVLETEFGGLPESLANLYRITGSERYLRTAQRFYHARFLDPLAAGDDALRGEQCNVSLPKVIAACGCGRRPASRSTAPSRTTSGRSPPRTTRTSSAGRATTSTGRRLTWWPARCPTTPARAASPTTCSS